jgi:hypothetical protein
MAESIEPHAGREAAIELRLGGRVGRAAGLGNPARERAVVERREPLIIEHEPRIANISEDV